MLPIALVAFAKNPRTQKVKTRLGASLGKKEASLLYEALLADCLENLKTVENTQLYIACADEKGHNFFGDLSERFGTDLVEQEGSDLGERMLNCLEILLVKHEGVIILGTDVPVIDLEAIQEAVQAVKEWDVVVGPSKDGGYYAFGAKQVKPGLFDGVSWSSNSVLDITLENCRRLSLRVHILPEAIDVDELDSLNAVIPVLRARQGMGLATRRVLDSLGFSCS